MTEGFPYFTAVLFGLPQLLFAFLVAGPQRCAMLASGFLFLPWVLGAPLFDSYWSPTRIGDLPIGIEDLLYCFQTGAACWFWGSLADRQRLVLDLRPQQLARRCGLIALPIAAAMAILHAAGMPAIGYSLAVTTGVVVVLLALRPWLWRVALAASLGYTTTYVVFLWEVFMIWPEATGLWPTSGPAAARVLGVPLMEIAFAAIGAPAHALVVAVASQANFADPPTATASPAAAGSLQNERTVPLLAQSAGSGLSSPPKSRNNQGPPATGIDG